MKTKLLMLLLPFFCLSAMGDEPKTQLVVWAKDGTTVAFALAEKPKVTFTNTHMVITTNNADGMEFPLEETTRFTYEPLPVDAVRDILTDNVSFRIDVESLLFPTLKANSTVSIHSLDGTLVFKKTVQTAGEYSFPLSNLNAGVYVVSVNGLTYKIVKR